MENNNIPTFQYPSQHTSRSEKEKDSFYKPTYDFLINKAISLNPKDEIKNWLQAANGIISNESLDYFVSPLKDDATEKAIGKMPGEIRDTDLINMVREKNMGDYIGIPYKFTVVVNNEDSVFKRDIAVRDRVMTLMEQALVNKLNESFEEKGEGINTNMPSKEVPDIEKFAKDFIKNWIDDRAINGFNLLKLLNDVNDFDNKRLQAFFYWWSCEEFYTYREIINNEVYTSIISPLEGYPIINDEQFVEDFDGFVIKRKTTLTQVKERYFNDLSETEKEYITKLCNGNNSKKTVTGEFLYSRSWNTTMKGQFASNRSMDFDVTDASESLDEYTIIWRTEIPIKVRKYKDILGNELEEKVDDNYEQIEGVDIEVRTEWIEEVYIGIRFGDAVKGIYLKPFPCDVQRYDKHKLHPKLPVGGKKGILRNLLQNPIPNRLIPYVIIDRLITAQQERTMAKYQGYLTVIPQSMLNDDATGTRKEKMFYIKADNTLIYDDTTVDINVVNQGFQVKNFQGLENYLQVLITLKDKNKQEALEMSNLNDLTLGNVQASTGKGVMQESISRAKLGNALMITMFNSALEKDHTADLEFAKVAYNEDIKRPIFDRSNNSYDYIDINITSLRESDLGVFVENSKLQEDKLSALKNIAFSLSQNGDVEAAVAAVEYDSIPELRKAIKELVKAKREFDEAIAAKDREAQQYVADANLKAQQVVSDTDIAVANINKESRIAAAEIQASSQNVVPLNDNVNLEDNIGREQFEFKKQDAITKNNLRNKQIDSTERINLIRQKEANKKKQNKK